MTGLYCIVNLENNKYYVGSSNNLEKRTNRHWFYLQNRRHPNKKLQADFDTYGADAFEFRILATDIEPQELLRCEQFWMDHLKAIEDGYNQSPTAGTRQGMKGYCSPETRQKISNSLKNQVQSEETKAKRKATLKGRPVSATELEAKRKAWDRAKVRTFVCQFCDSEFETRARNTTVKYCSQYCREKAWYYTKKAP